VDNLTAKKGDEASSNQALSEDNRAKLRNLLSVAKGYPGSSQRC
jgi:hypothetical protein